MNAITVGRLHNVRLQKESPIDMGQLSVYCAFDWQGTDIQPIAEAFAKCHAAQEGYTPNLEQMEAALTLEFVPVSFCRDTLDKPHFQYRLFVDVPELGKEDGESRHNTFNGCDIAVLPEEERELRLFLCQTISEYLFSCC